MEERPLLLDHTQGILTLTLNRPDKLNALTLPMVTGLTEALGNAETDPQVRVVVITGAGRGFCSGQDLAIARAEGAGTTDADYGERLEQTLNPLIMQMRQLPKPIVAAVNGAAAGAGMSIALACDWRIAAESASFVQAFINIGLIPDGGSTWFLPRLVGFGRAFELMVSGRKVNAQEAYQIGMVNQLVPDDQLGKTVKDIAGLLAVAPTRTIGYMKQAIEFAMSNPLEESLTKEADLQSLAGHSQDHVEGLMAFLEKRIPQFKGR